MKKLLRSKANFGVLNGFLSELMKEEIRIVEVLGSEALPENYNAQGLKEASEKLSFMHLSGAELEAYEQYEKQLHIQASEVEFSIKRALRAEAALEDERQQKEED